MESGLTRRAGRYIDPGDHRYSSRVAGAVEIRRISEPGIGPYLPRVRRNCAPSVSEPLSSSYYMVGAAVELEPIRDSGQWNWGFHTMGSGVDPRELGFLPPFVYFLYI